jgi:hypothetical protein
MSLDPKLPILITCTCETAVPVLEAVSKSQKCSKSTCGLIPCKGDSCEPNFDNWTIDEKCYPQHYLKLTKTWQMPPPSSSSSSIWPPLSSSYTVGQNAALMLNILKLLENEEIDNLLDKNQENSNISINIQDVFSLGGEPARVETTECVVGPSLGPCECKTSDNGEPAYCDPNSSGVGMNTCPTNVYTDPTPDTCYPATMPGFPEFIERCSDQQPSLQPGQGRSSTAKDLDAPTVGIIDQQLVKYRIKHDPIKTGYLKVWIRKKVQNYVWQACDPSSGSGGSGAGTNCNPDTTCKSWQKSGEEEVSPVKEYVWESSQFIENPTCQDVIFSSEDSLIAENGTVATIEISKYSYVKGYTPDDPEVEPRCNPDGFPIKDPACS